MHGCDVRHFLTTCSWWSLTVLDLVLATSAFGPYHAAIASLDMFRSVHESLSSSCLESESAPHDYVVTHGLPSDPRIKAKRKKSFTQLK